MVSLHIVGFPGGSAGKESTCNVGDLGLIPGFGRSSGEGNGYSLQCSGLENSMDCIVHGVAKSWTGLSNFHDHDVITYMCTSTHSVVSKSWKAYGLWPARLLCPWNSPGRNTGVGSHSLLQGIFPTQGSNPGIPQCRQVFYQLSHQGSPRILEWVAYPFSKGTS